MPTRIRARAHPIDSVEAELPPSKSHVQRAVLLAGFGGWKYRLEGLGESADVAVCVRAVEAAGVDLRRLDRGVVEVAGFEPGWDDGPVRIDCGENGTVTRMVGALVGVLGGRVVLDGAEPLRRRPMDALTGLLRAHGVTVDGDRLPLTIDARAGRWETSVEVDGETTTQVASGLLLGLACRADAGATVVRVRRPKARDYVVLTVRVLSEFGFDVECTSDGDDLVIESKGATESCLDRWVAPPDPSALAFPASLAAMHGRGFVAPERRGDPHPDWDVLGDVARMAQASSGETLVFDRVASRPDGFPALAALAATRDGETRFVGAPALRAKESDRITAMARGLDALGVPVEELPDGLVVRGPMPDHASCVDAPAPADHRIVMALALLGSRSRGGVRLQPDHAVGKSWPAFWDWLADYADVARE